MEKKSVSHLSQYSSIQYDFIFKIEHMSHHAYEKWEEITVVRMKWNVCVSFLLLYVV